LSGLFSLSGLSGLSCLSGLFSFSGFSGLFGEIIHCVNGSAAFTKKLRQAREPLPGIELLVE
jgi:hypothetical protein